MARPFDRDDPHRIRRRQPRPTPQSYESNAAVTFIALAPLRDIPELWVCWAVPSGAVVRLVTGRWAERVAGVDSPFAVGFSEHKARAFRVGESRRRRVAVDVEVERGVGRARQRVRVETRPALFQYLLAPCVLGTAGELRAGLGGVAASERPEIGDNGLTDLLLV